MISGLCTLAAAAIFAAVSPSVVSVEGDAEPATLGIDYPDEADVFVAPPRKPPKRGSGFFVKPGFVLTCRHVVIDAGNLTVTTSGGEELVGAIYSTDAATDLALLRIEKMEDMDSPPNLLFGNEPPPGTPVFAFGSPLGMHGSMSSGICSFTDRLLFVDGRWGRFVQTDVAVGPGSSGGPLVDTDARVVAVCSMIGWSARGVTFAIPASVAERSLRHMLRGEAPPHPHLGVTLSGLDVVESGSQPFLQVGDKIVEVGGHPVKTADAVRLLVLKLPPDSSIRVAVLRGGSRMEGDLAVGSIVSP